MPELDSSGVYQPPGVYTTHQPIMPSSAAGYGPGLLALVGPSQGHRSRTEVVTLTGTTAVSLDEQGIDVASIVVRGTDGTLFEETDDYTVVVVDDEDLIDENDVTTVARTADSAITSGQRVLVSYNFEDTEFRLPHRFRSVDQVRLYYGEAIDADGAINSPLTLAAQIAFENGAGQIIAVATAGADTTSAADLTTAMDAIATSQEVGVVVPITAGISGGDCNSVLLALQQHCETASADSFYRIGIVGFAQDVTEAPDELAQGVASRRVVLAWPFAMTRYNPQLESHQVIGGQYLGAALGGIAVKNDPERALTNQLVRGFSGIEAETIQAMTALTMNQYAEAGVTVVYARRDRRLTVRHGLTTDYADIHDREISVVRSRDAMMALMEQTFLRSGIIGAPLNDETMATIKGLAIGGMEQCVNLDLITGYRNLGVMQQSQDPTIVMVSVEYGPPYPVNYINLVFAVSSTTGSVTESNLIAA